MTYVITDKCALHKECIDVCPVEAISLVAKPGMEAPPKDFPEMMKRVAEERGLV